MGITRDDNASYKLLAQELGKLGYTMSEQTLHEHLYVTYTSPLGRTWTTRAARIAYPFTSDQVLDLSRDKAVATEFALQQGVSAPDSLPLSSEDIDEAAVETFLKQHGRIVVKPLDRSLSMGLTTDVTTLEQAFEAIGMAAAFSQTVLLQQQVYGEEIRFTILNGTVVSALLRRTPRVIGDGQSTIAELIELENEKRKQVDYTMVPYPQLTADLLSPVIDVSAIPKKDEVIELSRSTMISRGCSVYDVLEKVDESYSKLAASLASGLNCDFLVVDLFVEDYRQPASTDNYWFIEFNTSPVIKLFYSCRDGNMHDVLPQLAETIDRKLHEPLGQWVVGSFEQVSFDEFGLHDITAKIDTGAYSGAIGCRDIKLIKRDGKKILTFIPGKRSKKIYETEHYQVRHVRSSSGHLQKRYIVDTEITLHGETLPISIGVSDRSEMKHEILIGRKFLRENNILVDVRRNQEYDTDREAR